MSPTPEERIAMLEERLTSMGEAIERVEKGIDKLEDTISALLERLDNRYPSQESVNLRFADMRTGVESLTKRVAAAEKEISRLKAWQYRIIGGIAVISFVFGWLLKVSFK